MAIETDATRDGIPYPSRATAFTIGDNGLHVAQLLV